MFTNKDIVPNPDEFNGKGASGFSSSSFPFASRIDSVHGMVSFMAIFIVIFGYMGLYLFNKLLVCTRKAKKETDKFLIKQHSYESLMHEYMDTTVEISKLDDNSEFRAELEIKLEEIGNELKDRLAIYDKGENEDPKNIPGKLLKEVLEKHKKELIIKKLEGLGKYRLMDNPNYEQFKEEWVEYHKNY